MRKFSAWLDELRQRPPGAGVEARYYEKGAVTGEDFKQVRDGKPGTDGGAGS